MTPSAPSPTRGPRALLLALALLAITSVLGLRLAFTPHDGGAILRLALAPSGAAFAQSVRDDWVQEAASPATPGTVREPWCGVGLPHVALASASAASAPVLAQLRCKLVADSVGLVPGYGGLLLQFTLAVVPAGGRPALRGARAAVAVAVAAGGFDPAEKGLAWRALEALQPQPLPDATLPDELVATVRHVSQAKWLLIALADALLGHLLFWHGTGPAAAKPRRVAALLLPGAAVLPAAGAPAWRPGISVGMCQMTAALAVLGRQMGRPGG
jgi:hypothetical protein